MSPQCYVQHALVIGGAVLDEERATMQAMIDGVRRMRRIVVFRSWFRRRYSRTSRCYTRGGQALRSIGMWTLSR